MNSRLVRDMTPPLAHGDWDTLSQPERQKRLHSFGAAVDEPSVAKWKVVAPLELLNCVIMRERRKPPFVLDRLCIRGFCPVDGHPHLMGLGKVCRRSAQKLCFSLPTVPFLNPDISDPEVQLAGARLHHAGVGSPDPQPVQEWTRWPATRPRSQNDSRLKI